MVSSVEKSKNPTNLHSTLEIEKQKQEKHIRGNLGSKMGLIIKHANNKFCELEFKKK